MIKYEHPEWCVRGFREAFLDCNVLDLPSLGVEDVGSQTLLKSISTELYSFQAGF